MAESIGLASGLLALATFAFQSSITLHNTVQSFLSHPKRVRDLIEELEALKGVLGPLTETISSTTEVDLSALDLPLLRCYSCKEFEQEITKCSTRSTTDAITPFTTSAEMSRTAKDAHDEEAGTPPDYGGADATR
ncbi:hypothetical protein MMC13_000868 [Lambiella insularis]|nr:hypothetical protein [Lambiella insularis]